MCGFPHPGSQGGRVHSFLRREDYEETAREHLSVKYTVGCELSPWARRDGEEKL